MTDTMKRFISGEHGKTATIETKEGLLTLHQAPKKEGGGIIGYLDKEASKTSGFDFAGTNIEILEGEALAAKAELIEDLDGNKKEVKQAKPLILAAQKARETVH